jgi:hypothetical protein
MSGSQFQIGADGNPIIPVDIPAAAPTPPTVTTPAPTSTQLWGRQLSLIVADQNGDGRELVVPISGGPSLHVTFSVKHQILSTPNTMRARIYNLSDQTKKYIASQGTLLVQANNLNIANGQIVLKAGYAGNYGIIFQGSIRQVRIGRENPTDTYVDIFGADGDFSRNWGIINTALAAGYSQADVMAVSAAYMKSFGVTAGTPPTVAPGSETTVPIAPPKASPRGRLLWGNIKDVLHDLAAAHDNTWNLNNNVLNFLPRTAYTPGAAVVLTSHTGLIGLPELTDAGVKARCLLNPALGVGSRVQIANSLIQQPAANLGYSALNVFPSLDADGFYKILWIDHTGDNRGTNWYSDFICISIDPSAQLPVAVQDTATGIPP